MKKCFAFALMFCFVLSAGVMLGACGKKEKTYQENNLSFNGIYQNSSADVFVDIDTTEFSDGNTPQIEVTADGGESWFGVSLNYVAIERDSDSLSEVTMTTFVALTYYEGDDTRSEGFYYATSTTKKVADVGDTVSLAVRLAETSSYKASDSSQGLDYTLKAKSEDKSFIKESATAQTEWYLSDVESKISYENSLTFLDTGDSVFKITSVQVVDDNEENEGHYIASPILETEEQFSNYEIKFLNFDEAFDSENGVEYDLLYRMLLENQISTSGWQAFDNEVGITASSYESFQGEIATYYADQVHRETVVYLFVRQKATDSTVKGSVSLVKLSISLSVEALA